MSPAIHRPPTDFEPVEHKYTLDGQDLLGISTAAKIGGAEETWGIASAWGFRIGYEGAHEIAKRVDLSRYTPDELRAEMKRKGLTPWSKRDKAADRGNWVHDVLEGLAQRGDIPNLSQFSDEYRGHAQAVMCWYVDYRPRFVATEVQVTSRRLGVAGRYDIEALIPAVDLLPLFEDHISLQSRAVERLAHEESALCLIDLKTSKGIYPTTHFPQLSGYELCRQEMGFKPTHAQFILNTHPDGSYDFQPSWSTPEDFEGYVAAMRAIRSVEANDPETRRKARREEEVLGQLPAKFGEIELERCTRGVVKGLLASMQKKKKITYDKGTWRVTAE